MTRLRGKERNLPLPQDRLLPMYRDRRIWLPLGALRAAILILAAGLAAIAIPASAAETLRGVALVIGNGEYENLTPLANPDTDARAIADLFEDLGFETLNARDADARKLRRAIERFVADAEGADVAIVYYAGHGIEAGGENFLVPVDADIAALDHAGDKLVPLTALMDDLRAAVPMTIVLLDACRDNPFPPGAMVRATPDAAPAPIAAGGLGETRGVTRFGGSPSTSASPADDLGALIGFAAEPGKRALDGEPGGNSPYAAAVLRHLAAMTGEEFGTVMRMVAEEVYLKTSGAQRPWVNESLRRLLYFGSAPKPVPGEEGQILAERRQLLLTIAALPDIERRQVERVASAGGVPMDALYGMLRAIGADLPKDPAMLEKLLDEQAARLKEMLLERATLKSTDPEITRLSSLAATAIAEGALESAIRLNEEAKKRIAELSATVDQAEADILRRRLEFAEVYARSGDAYALNFAHLKAAEDYARAFAQVTGRDQHLAWTYKRLEARAFAAYGEYSGDNGTLERSILAGREALEVARLIGDPLIIGGSQFDLGITLASLGAREGGTARIEEAATAFRAALGIVSRETDPIRWASAATNLATSLRYLGEREPGPTRLAEAVAAYRDVIAVSDPAADPTNWSVVQGGLGATLVRLGERTGDVAMLEEAVTALRESLRELTRDRQPLEWAAVLYNLGTAYSALGRRRAENDFLHEAVAALNDCLTVFTVEKTPHYWALTKDALGSTLQELGIREQGTERLHESVAAYRDALTLFNRERAPIDWAAANNNLANALRFLGQRELSAPRMRESVAALQDALKIWTRGALPVEWAMAQRNLGDTLQMLGKLEANAGILGESVAVYRLALEETLKERDPIQWTEVQLNLGYVLQAIATIRNDPASLAEAVTAYRLASSGQSRKDAPADWALTQGNLATALLDLAKRTQSKMNAEEGRAAMVASWDAYREAGQTGYDAFFTARLAEADALLKSLK